jgi:hypothetical protein
LPHVPRARASPQLEDEVVPLTAPEEVLDEMVAAIRDDEESVVGLGCDDQFEFKFALDLMLDGLERLRERAGRSREEEGP